MVSTAEATIGNVQNIYCNKPGKAHFLARINGAVEIYCVACKRWEPVSVVDIVRARWWTCRTAEPEQGGG